MVIAVQNLDRLVKKYNRLGNIDMKPIMQRATQLVQRTAKEMAPVDTGHLRRNIMRKTHTLPNNTGIVGEVYDPVEYGVYQEFGTSKMKAQPFMRPALKVHQETIKKGFEDYLKQHNRRAVQ